jgi:hypothetical protein
MADKKSTVIYILICCVLIQGISGIIGGISLISDPTGSNIDLSILLLKDSPFKDYLLPGIILLSILGIYPIIVFVGLYKGKYWALCSAKLLGIVLMLWVVSEIITIEYKAERPLQLISGLLGLLILVFANFTNIQSFYIRNQIAHKFLSR